MTGLPEPQWLAEDAPDAEVVVSTRIRLARNLVSAAFPWRADPGTRAEVAKAVIDALRRAGGPWCGAVALGREELDDEQAAALADARYTTREWGAGAGGQAIVLSPDGALSALINEEDHVRLQCLLPGLQVREAFQHTSRAAEGLGAQLPLATHPDFGYLTASPANVGSGLRASAWVHLPALASDGRLRPVLDAAVELGSTVRGTHGEGTSGTGELFQLSNTWAAARAPERAVERLTAAAAYVVGEERSARAVRFGGGKGRAALREVASEALHLLMVEDAAPRRLLQLVSVLRLAVAEGVIAGGIADTARWLAIAGGVDPEAPSAVSEAPARSARLRQVLAETRTTA